MAVLLGGLAFASLAGCASKPIHSLRAEGDHDYKYGRYEEASVAYGEIIERWPGDWEAEYRYGMCLVRMDKPALARTHIETAAARNPQSQEVCFALADVYAALDERGRMVQILRDRAARYADIEAWLKLAALGEQLHDLDIEALAMTSAMDMRGPDRWQAYVYASDVAGKRGDAALAERRIRQAYGLNPNSPIVVEKLRAIGLEPGGGTALPPGV
jgi:predicted Zn-dependent protease